LNRLRQEPIKALNLFSDDQKLITCKDSDKLLTVLKMMMQHRISVVPVESHHKNQSYTVGLCFLNDLRYLLKLPDFTRYLDWPILRFIKEMNYYDPEEFDLDDTTYNQEFN